MDYGASEIDSLMRLPTAELIRKRPGMYIGATDRVGAAVMLAAAAAVLFGLTVDRSGARRPLVYGRHMFLDLSLIGRRGTVLLDYDAIECPDFEDRCAYLCANRDLLGATELETHDQADIANFPIISALSTGLVIKTHAVGGPRTILQDDDPVDVTFPPARKDSQIAIAFDLRELFDLSAISQDFLEGFVRGAAYIPGVVIRSVTHKAQ